MKTPFLPYLIRRTGLIKTADKVRYYLNLAKTYRGRKEFFKKNPGIKLPPAYYMYETFSLDYSGYYHKSRETAQWLMGHFKEYKYLEELNILDWGCGPGRVIRHLPEFCTSCNFFGTDYNKKYIKWCRENIPEVRFEKNELQPPLVFEDHSMDIIYGISIFTHLSEEMHYAWFRELMRVLKPGGILFITLHGDAFRIKLTHEERSRFDKGQLLVKAQTKEGHRTYAAFQPETFVRSMIGNHEVLVHIPGEIAGERPQQDVWIIRRSQVRD